jgi:hypothetical protein
MSGTTEYVVKGGTHLYPKCREVFESQGYFFDSLSIASLTMILKASRKLVSLVGAHKHLPKLKIYVIRWPEVTSKFQ